MAQSTAEVKKLNPSYYPDGLIPPKTEHIYMPTWVVLVVLVLALVLIKSLIYIKDPKRHDK